MADDVRRAGPRAVVSGRLQPCGGLPAHPPGGGREARRLWGAITGITFAAHEPRITAIAAIVAGGNFLGPLRTDVPQATQEAARRMDPIYHVALLAPRPLLLLNVTRDQLVPRFYADSLHRAAGDVPTVTKRWLETEHFFNGVNRHGVLDSVIDFMETAMTKR